MKKLLMMVLPGVLALSVSVSMACEDKTMEAAPGVSKMTQQNSQGNERAIRDLILSLVTEMKAQKADFYADLNVPADTIPGADKIPHWVCNP